MVVTGLGCLQVIKRRVLDFPKGLRLLKWKLEAFKCLCNLASLIGTQQILGVSHPYWGRVKMIDSRDGGVIELADRVSEDMRYIHLKVV